MSRFADFCRRHRSWLIVFLLLMAFMLVLARRGVFSSNQAVLDSQPALTVSLLAPQSEEWAETLTATGSVFAWQETIIGAEIANYRIATVVVQVGDSVKKGQVLATISPETVKNELAEADASVAEFQVAAAEAKNNAVRAQTLRERGFYSEQMNTQYQTAAHTAAARLLGAEARASAARTRLDKTVVRAQDDGLISAQSAVVGSLTQPGQELFRLIRGGRLEWRAEIASGSIHKIATGQTVVLTLPDASTIEGKVRTISPQINPQTRNALIYVDLPKDTAARAGMFASGHFVLGMHAALTVPQSAVVLRDGFAYVFVPEEHNEGEEKSAKKTVRLIQTKVDLGRRQGDRVEIISGISPDTQLVATGVGFLADGDRVRILTRKAAP